MTRVRLMEFVGDFAGDKDVAAELREEKLKPALASGKPVTLDFEDVNLATQSFIHALISDLVRSPDFDALDLLTFEHCNESVTELIEIVAEYSQDNLELEPE